MRNENSPDKRDKKRRDNIVIIDTGCANINSVRFAIERLGYKTTISYDPQRILAADKLFLPGVGTAAEAMKNLEQRELIAQLQHITQPLLGICLGMQLLGNTSQEGSTAKNNHKLVNTLGHINADTCRINTTTEPLPHMGWNTVAAIGEHPLFNGIPAHSHFYFVHSYAMPVCPQTIAQCHYSSPFSAAVQNHNYYGVQFHPERSSKAGLQLIHNFLEM